MTKADKYLIKLLCDIKTHGFKDENPRPHWPDGTPAHTLSVNHQIREYDISGRISYLHSETYRY